MSETNSGFSDDPLATQLIRCGLCAGPVAMFLLAGLARFPAALPVIQIGALLAVALFWAGLIGLYVRYRGQAVVQKRDGLRQQVKWLRAKLRRQARDLRAARKRRDRLARDERAELAAALREMQAAHLQNGLTAALLADASIPALGPGLKERLLAQGIASAADIDAMRLLSVRGLGDAQSQALLAWRNGVAARLNLTMPVVLPTRRLASLEKTFERQHAANDAEQAEAMSRMEVCEGELVGLQSRIDELAGQTFRGFLHEHMHAWHRLAWPLAIVLIAGQIWLPIGLLSKPAWTALAELSAPRPTVVRIFKSPSAPAQERPVFRAAPTQLAPTRTVSMRSPARSPTPTTRPTHTRRTSSTPRVPTRTAKPGRNGKSSTPPAVSNTLRAARTPTETHTPRPSKTPSQTKTAGPTRTPSPTKTLKPTRTPTETASPTVTIPADEFQDLVSLTSPIARGGTASITVRTNPGAPCSIKVILKSGASHAKSLAPTTAGDDGVCSWTWKISTRTAAGTWSVSVKTGDVEVKYPFVIE